MEKMRELSYGELGALCSNLAKACTKQFYTEEAQLFTQLAEYYQGHSAPAQGEGFQELAALVERDLKEDYPQAAQLAKAEADRGALRALVWGEKVSKLLKSLLSRYEKQQDALLEKTSVYVCEICGFIYVGDVPPEICPICKVPSFKLQKIQREAV